MADERADALIKNEPKLMIALGIYAIVGCLIFAIAILIADFVVPDHDWIADTISDLGAGKYEFIVDIGIYAFSASLISCALLASHVHMGGWGWSFAILGLAILGLIVFLIGARNEYGDSDSEGVVIHIYLVYALGLLFVLVPWLMADGAERAGPVYSLLFKGISFIWLISAPVFFFLPDAVDGIYERYLGLLAFVIVSIIATFFIRRGRKLQEQARLN